METKWHWFRIECQSHSAAYVHSCLRIKNDPDIDKLIQDILKFHIAQYWLEIMNYVEKEDSNNDWKDNKFLNFI